MKSHFSRFFFSVFYLILLVICTSCVERPNFDFDNFFDPLSEEYSKSLTETNIGYYFSGGSLDGFSTVWYSTADYEGGVFNNDGEHLCIWITNAQRARGGGWFWGGWERILGDPLMGTNLYGTPPAGHRWLMAIKIRSTNSSVLHDRRQIVLTILATNNANLTSGQIEYVSPSPIPGSDSIIYLDISDFDLYYYPPYSTMTSVRDVLENVESIRFSLYNDQYLDGDSFGFIIDYIIFGYW